MIILSIDSGLEKTGYALFDKNKKIPEGFKYLESGLILTSKIHKLEERIRRIYTSIKKIIKRTKPEHMIIEQLFFFKNLKTAVSVAQAQGTLLLVAAQEGIPVTFLTPLQIKQIITGYGQADKKSVQKMLRMTLQLDDELKKDDVADAIACGAAYCYITNNGTPAGINNSN